MTLFEKMLEDLGHLRIGEVMREGLVSQAQMYEWRKEVKPRKEREPKRVDGRVVKATLKLIADYPHMSAPKGQAYLIYHRVGYLPQHLYKSLKKIFRALVMQEAANRKLFPPNTSYTHERPDQPGDVWAEDFTKIIVGGVRYALAVLIDVASTCFLGAAVAHRATARFVGEPVDQALRTTGGVGPRRFMLSDNGSQYISDEHGDQLKKSEIVGKRIPACRPEYNGAVECGIKEFKQVFYNVWAAREANGEGTEKPLLTRVRAAVEETMSVMNLMLPRPCLGGVTPQDVFSGADVEKRAENQAYVEAEWAKPAPEPWKKTKWEMGREALVNSGMDDQELFTKFCFFLKRPLRKIANLLPAVLREKRIREAVG